MWNGTHEADSEREGESYVKSFEVFNPWKDVERLYNAMEGPETNEDELIKVLAHRSLVQRHFLRHKFKETYDQDLEYRLFGEISGWFKSTIQGLMNPEQMLASDLRMGNEEIRSG